MPEIHSQGAINKLNKVEAQLKLTIEKALLDMGQKMQNEIVDASGRAFSLPMKKFGGRYFEEHRGLLDIIAQSPIDSNIENNIIRVGVGHIPTLDALTIEKSAETHGKRTTKPVPFWRLFEYGNLDTLTRGGTGGGSKKYSFFSPFRDGKRVGGYGRRGDGWAKEIKGDKKGFEGVKGTNMFGDTLNYFRSEIITTVQRRVERDLKQMFAQG